MRESYRIGFLCLIPLFSIVGFSLLIHGGVNIPSNLTIEEAIAAGTAQNQLIVLEQKRNNSSEYKQIIAGASCIGISMSLCLLSILVYNMCPSILIHDVPHRPDTHHPDAANHPDATKKQPCVSHDKVSPNSLSEIVVTK